MVSICQLSVNLGASLHQTLAVLYSCRWSTIITFTHHYVLCGVISIIFGDIYFTEEDLVGCPQGHVCAATSQQDALRCAHLIHYDDRWYRTLGLVHPWCSFGAAVGRRCSSGCRRLSKGLAGMVDIYLTVAWLSWLSCHGHLVHFVMLRRPLGKRAHHLRVHPRREAVLTIQGRRVTLNDLPGSYQTESRLSVSYHIVRDRPVQTNASLSCVVHQGHLVHSVLELLDQSCEEVGMSRD